MRRIVLALLGLGLIALPVVLDPGRAYACSCVGISTQRAFVEADAVFSGTVRAIGEVGSRKERRVDIRFDVDRVYKGTAYRTQIVSSNPDSASCGISPQVGSSWTIFAEEEIEGRGELAVTRLRTGLCSGNLPSATPPIRLGNGFEPRSGESDRVERAVQVDARATQVLLVAGIGTLALLALVGIGLAVLWRPRRVP